MEEIKPFKILYRDAPIAGGPYTIDNFRKLMKGLKFSEIEDDKYKHKGFPYPGKEDVICHLNGWKSNGVLIAYYSEIELKIKDEKELDKNKEMKETLAIVKLYYNEYSGLEEVKNKIIKGIEEKLYE